MTGERGHQAAHPGFEKLQAGLVAQRGIGKRRLLHGQINLVAVQRGLGRRTLIVVCAGAQLVGGLLLAKRLGEVDIARLKPGVSALAMLALISSSRRDCKPSAAS